MSEPLKPCPFCGNPHPGLKSIRIFDNGQWAVECGLFPAQQVSSYSRLAAVQSWNRGNSPAHRSAHLWILGVMMTRPEWCPEDVWRLAGRHSLIWTGKVLQKNTETIARAIIAERERCAKLAATVGREMGHENRNDLIARAIRKGESTND